MKRPMVDPAVMADRSPNPGLEHLFGRKVYIETYGCRYNFGDSAKLIEVLKNHGSVIVADEEDADAVVLNTCTVVSPTERRMLRRISHFRDRPLTVTGCMSVVQEDKIRAICAPVIIHPRTIQESYRTVNAVPGGDAGIVQVAQGCRGRCTYCVTRFARGGLRSFPLDDVLSQVRAFARSGTAEIQMTAQDVSAWGRDFGFALPDLLRACHDLPPPSMVRVGMMNPATVYDILDDLIDAFASDRIFRFLHLPVQSGSDRVLEQMGRDYTVAQYLEIVAAFRRRYPDIILMTDIIVGFPTETEEDFQASLDLVDRILPNKVNVTRYSRRPLTPLWNEYDYPDSVKKDRSRILQARAEKHYAAINAPLVGTVIPFTVTETIRPGSVMARTPNYTGIVINEDLPAGKTGKAVIRKDRRYFFIGERLP